MKRLALLLLVTLSALQVGQAQKYGHLNFGNLLAALPETKSADSQIQEYSNQLIAQGEQRAKSLQDEYTGVVQKIQNGEMSPQQQKVAEQNLQKKQQDLQQFELEVQQKIAQKRQELLAPIIGKVQTAIDAVAKEKGMVMVFDTSVFNAILFSEDSDDIMAEVKAKLGVQ